MLCRVRYGFIFIFLNSVLVVSGCGGDFFKYDTSLISMHAAKPYLAVWRYKTTQKQLLSFLGKPNIITRNQVNHVVWIYRGCVRMNQPALKSAIVGRKRTRLQSLIGIVRKIEPEHRSLKIPCQRNVLIIHFDRQSRFIDTMKWKKIDRDDIIHT